MLLCDNRDSKIRIIIFGTQTNIQSLQQSKSWYIDGTFDCCPQQFDQLITIQAEFQSTDINDNSSWCSPCLRILLVDDMYTSKVYT